MSASIWKEIDNVGKIKFNEILRVLNNFYGSMVKNKTRDFKFLLPKAQNTKIYLQKLDDYSYLIFAEIIEPESTMRENWIHIDGIKEEQERFTSLGILEHAIFAIPCLTEVYENNSEVVDFDPKKFNATIIKN
ncbi:LIC_13246 family protein [Leptospira kmetyi]|uniref:Uncharacterized protein n=1 Tax=Leptospira kmetyi TaxID=408139 RepID=A0ABX4N4N6_9LEPT|nr:hypothetical protein [Leptospira kmetyi]PJZ28387.1 hypothetical protein CH378_18090 [Leptospira kmetyi]